MRLSLIISQRKRHSIIFGASILWWIVLGASSIPFSRASEIISRFQNATQYIRSIVYTVNGLETGAPIIQINKEQTGPVIRIRSEWDNALAIQAGNLRDGSMLRPDLWFDLIANPILCGPWEWFIRKINQDGRWYCKKIGSWDVTNDYDTLFQRRIKWPCPDNMFIKNIERDWRVICEFPDRDFLISLLADHFEWNIGDTCPERTLMIGVENTGNTTKVKCGSLVEALSSLQCAPWHAIEWFSTNGIVCVPTNPAFRCPNGESIVWYTNQADPICGENTSPDCPAWQVYRGWSCWSPFWTHTQCQPHQWLQWFTASGAVLCGQAQWLCSTGQLLAGVAVNGSLICKPVEPINCIGSRSERSTCDKTCWWGIQTRTYTITQQAVNWWTACPATNWQQESRSCNTQPCSPPSNPTPPPSDPTPPPSNPTPPPSNPTPPPSNPTPPPSNPTPVNCIGSRSERSTCDKTCWWGTQTRTYTITQQAANWWTACPATNWQQDSRSCNTQPCPPPSNPPAWGWWWSSCKYSTKHECEFAEGQAQCVSRCTQDSFGCWNYVNAWDCM